MRKYIVTQKYRGELKAIVEAPNWTEAVKRFNEDPEVQKENTEILKCKVRTKACIPPPVAPVTTEPMTNV